MKFFALVFTGLLVLSSCTGSAAVDRSKIDFGEYTPLEGTVMTETEYAVPGVSVQRQEDRLVMNSGSLRIDMNLQSGLADVYRQGQDSPVISGLFAETEIDGKKAASSALERFGQSVYLEEVDDEFGAGVKVSVKNSGSGLILWQNFYLYRSYTYVLLETVVESPAGVVTNYIAPIAAGYGDPNQTALSIAPAVDPRFLFVPWDNDGFIRYRSDRLAGAGESYEVTAIFDNTSREGLVTGSVTHDTWKTGIRAKTGGRQSAVTEFRVFGGIATNITRDTQPHGSLIGHQVYSPKVFLGFYRDWRDGMEEFGRANALVAPALPWDDGPPFGWNSWSAVANYINYEIYMGASDFLKRELPGFANDKGVVYINLDSFWGDNMTPVQIRDAVQRVKANGQRPGTYSGFYSYWDGENWGRTVEGTNGRYNYGQIVLKDRRGRPLPPVDGARALDPTHPGTIMLAHERIKELVDYGFEYVKLDFMAHGALEGSFYNKDIRTGIQAYNYGMQKFLDQIQDRLDKKDFFISLSIAPTFPAQYAHARRISCDVFGSISSTEYMLNSLSYGWWLGGTVYAFNDPDHLVTYNSYNHRDPHSYNEGLSSYISKAISGFMVNSDDFRQPEARQRAIQIMNNDEVNRMTSSGRSFRPVEGNTGERSCDIFVRHDREEGVTYLAVFNFSDRESKTARVDLTRIGLDPGKTWRVRNLISRTDEAQVSGGFMTLTMEPAEPKLFRLY